MRRPVTSDTGDQADGPDGADAVGPRTPDRDKRSSPLAVVRETAVLVVLAVLLAVVFKTFLIQAFYIPSGSMEPTLDISDRVLVEKVSYRFGDVKRGDVIVFVHNDSTLDEPQPNLVARFFIGLGQAVGVTPPSDRDFIKRVVGVPGDKLSCSGGKLHRNGARVDEPYLPPDTTTDCGPTTVPAGKLFVMGDNRNNSQDSRVFGAIDRSSVVGRAFVRIWPFSRAGWLRRDQ